MKELFLPALLFYCDTRLHIHNKSAPHLPPLEALPSAAPALELTESLGTRQRADLSPLQGAPARGHTRRGEAGAQTAAAGLRDHLGLAR